MRDDGITRRVRSRVASRERTPRVVVQLQHRCQPERLERRGRREALHQLLRQCEHVSGQLGVAPSEGLLLRRDGVRGKGARAEGREQALAILSNRPRSDVVQANESRIVFYSLVEAVHGIGVQLRGARDEAHEVATDVRVRIVPRDRKQRDHRIDVPGCFQL